MQVLTLSEPFTFVKPDMDKERNKLLSTMVLKYSEYPILSEAMMKEMYEFYDANFFYGLLSKQVGDMAAKSAGSLRMGNPVLITLSQSIFRDVVEGNAKNRMDAIMCVMEHSLHLTLTNTQLKGTVHYPRQSSGDCPATQRQRTG